MLYKFFIEFGYHVCILFILCVGISFFSPVFYTHPIQGFLDTWIIFFSYTLVIFLIRFILLGLYKTLFIFIHPKVWIHKLYSLGIFLLNIILIGAYFSEIYAIIYYWIVGDAAIHMFLFIYSDGWENFLYNSGISTTLSITIILLLIGVYSSLFFVFYGISWILFKYTQPSFKKKIGAFVISFLLGCVLTGVSLYNFKKIYFYSPTNKISTNIENVNINKQIGWFSVVDIAPLQILQLSYLQHTISPKALEYFNTYKTFLKNRQYTIQHLNKIHGWSILFPPNSPILAPQLPKSKKKNILFFVVDTTRYDVFQEVVKTDPWLQNFMKQNSVFTNHYATGNLTIDSVLALFTSFPNYAKIQKNTNSSIYRYYMHFASLFHLNKSWAENKKLFPWTQSHIAYPIFVRSIMLNYPHNRQMLGGIECITFAVIPPLWCENARVLQKKQSYFLNIWDLNIAFINILNQHSRTPFFAYIQPQLVHGIQHNLTKNKKKMLKASQHALQTSLLMFKYMVEELKARGLYDNTIIILTSDHGELYGEYGLIGHGNVFDKTMLHVPMIVHWPKEKAHVYTHRTSHYDIVATFMKDYFNYQGDIKKISIGKSLFDPSKQWKYLPITEWGNETLWKFDGSCFSLSFETCNPISKPVVTKQSLDKMLYFLNLQEEGFGLIK